MRGRRAGASKGRQDPGGGLHLRGGFRDAALARYLANGSPDRSFGSNGRVTTDFGGDDQTLAAALQPDGKLVVSGSSDAGIVSTVIARYLAR